MFGAIAGDIIGSVFECNPIKTTDFPLFCSRSVFTDDTVLTVAVAYAIMNDDGYAKSIKNFGRAYPNAGYGGNFRAWLFSERSEPYNSWGNGSAMRVSPVGFAFNTEEEVIKEAKKSAEVTHNHPEGIKGAQATALAIFFAKKGQNKDVIKNEIADRFDYDLNRTIEQIRPDYSFDESCQGTVPEAIIAFLESDSYENAVRKAVSLGGDSDTLACIAGGIAQAYYKQIPDEIISETEKKLPKDLLDIVKQFNRKYIKI